MFILLSLLLHLFTLSFLHLYHPFPHIPYFQPSDLPILSTVHLFNESFAISFLYTYIVHFSFIFIHVPFPLIHHFYPFFIFLSILVLYSSFSPSHSFLLSYTTSFILSSIHSVHHSLIYLSIFPYVLLSENFFTHLSSSYSSNFPSFTHPFHHSLIYYPIFSLHPFFTFSHPSFFFLPFFILLSLSFPASFCFTHSSYNLCTITSSPIGFESDNSNNLFSENNRQHKRGDQFQPPILYLEGWLSRRRVPGCKRGLPNALSPPHNRRRKTAAVQI